MGARTLRTIGLYTRPRLLIVLAMGFASGLPLALTGATLQLRLRDAGVSLTAIGLFALVQLSYNFKALWAPLLDRVAVPGLGRLLGRRRAWLLIIQVLLAASILGLGVTPPNAVAAIVICAVAVAFFSASQDIVIDAYRIELLSDEEQGAGAATTQMGYRLGMLASGAGALYAAAAFDWSGAYALMAGLLLLGMGVVLAAPSTDRPASTSLSDGARRPRRGIFEAVAASRTFLRRVLPPGRPWAAILIFLLLYKLGSAIAEHMATPLYHDLGFTKTEIANISKLLGTAATILGVTLGGWLVYKIGALKSLLVTGILQTATNGLYIVLAHAGHDLTVLAVTITADNLAIGLNSAAIVAYLSALCDRDYTATQYALFSALMLVGRNLFASVSGGLAEALGWIPFFAVSMALAIPGLIILLWLMRRTPPLPEFVNA